MHCSGRQGERADSSPQRQHLRHDAPRRALIHYLREGMLRGASSWEMCSYQREPGFGLFARDVPRLCSMNYWLYYHFNRHVGRWVLASTAHALSQRSDAGRTYRGPLTPAVATLERTTGSGCCYVLANGSWADDRAGSGDAAGLRSASRHGSRPLPFRSGRRPIRGRPRGPGPGLVGRDRGPAADHPTAAARRGVYRDRARTRASPFVETIEVVQPPPWRLPAVQGGGV